MVSEYLQKPLGDKKGLVIGIANEHSIAYGCAKAFRMLGADLAITYLNDKNRPFVEPLAMSSEHRFSCRATCASQGSLKRYFTPSVRPGAGWISRFMRLPLPPRRICTDG